MRYVLLFALALLAAAQTPLSTVPAGPTLAVPVDSTAWTFSPGATHRVDQHLRRPALFLDGRAYLAGFETEAGILEVDIAPNTDRGFAGVLFRVQPDDNGHNDFEEVYLRLHKSGLPDAVQYAPIYNGQSTWQLYRMHQTRAEFRRTGWTTLRVVFAGRRADVYLDDRANPVLQIDHLRHDHAAGSIGLFALFGNHFSNIRFTPLPPQPMPDWSQPAQAGVITSWTLSPAIPATEIDVSTYPWSLLAADLWITAQTEPSGLLPIAKYRKRPISGRFERNPEDIVWARTELMSDTSRRLALHFDYSDKAAVYLNGRLLYAGDNAFRSKGLLERGDLSQDANTLFLDLEPGSNELLVAVTERANGWGLTARVE
ncbi:MAG: hypothetical protein AAGI08_08665 [Bacteroidota bacterium]